MFRKSSTTQNVVTFSLGLVAGWFVKQLFDSPKFQNQREQVMITANELRQRLVDFDEDGRIKTIFGKNSKEFKQIYQETREKIINELETLQIAFDEIDKEKYSSIVTEVLDSLKDSRLGKEQIENLSQALLADFKKINRRRQQVKKNQELSSKVEDDFDE